MSYFCFFFQAEDGIRDLVRSRGLGDVYKRQDLVRADSDSAKMQKATFGWLFRVKQVSKNRVQCFEVHQGCQYLGFEANPGFS